MILFIGMMAMVIISSVMSEREVANTFRPKAELEAIVFCVVHRHVYPCLFIRFVIRCQFLYNGGRQSFVCDSDFLSKKSSFMVWFAS